MNFDDKKLKVTALRIPGWSIENRLEILRKINANKACRLDDLPMENKALNVGWASGKSELVTDMTEDDVFVADNLYLSLRIATRKVPGSIANALLRRKMVEYMKKNFCEYVPVKAKRELKKEVVAKLIGSSVPSIKSVWVVIRPDGAVLAGSCGGSDIGTLAELIYKTFDLDIVPEPALSFSDEDLTNIKIDVIAFEFLTDLFRRSEEESNAMFTLIPPFDFVTDGAETRMCVRAVAYGDSAQGSSEVRTALNENKRLARANVMFCGDGVPGYLPSDRWELTVNANRTIASLKLPDGEEMEFAARFVERLDLIQAAIGWVSEQMKTFSKRLSSSGYETEKRKWLDAR